MSFSNLRPSPYRSLAHRAAAIFFAGGLVAYWLAPRETPPSRDLLTMPTPSTATAIASADTVREKVQTLLAEGGCPGWIALANDPGLLPPTGVGQGVYPVAIRETAARQTDSPPRVRYPAPIRVAAVPGDPIAGVGEMGGMRLVQLPSVADEELIPEEEDLLFTTPGIAGADDASKEDGGDEAAPIAPSNDSIDKNVEDVDEHAGEGEDELIGSEDDLMAPGDGADAAPPEAKTNETPEPLPPPDDESSSEDLLNDRDDLLEPGPPVAPPPIRPALPVPPVFAPPEAAPPAGGASSSASSGEAKRQAEAESRCEFVARTLYPSALECRVCHEKIYEEWSASSHAYAFVSPMFHKFEQKINDLTQGTIGYFCYRCHTPAGTSLGLSRAAPIWDAPLVAREGVTCVACHRVREMYGKTNGERRIEPGPIWAPVYGSIGGAGVAAAAANKSHYKVKTSPHEQGPGQDMHALGLYFPQLGQSEFCTSCHQVAVYPGIKLEVVWEQYRASPACKKGIKCQDCHMGRIPGVPSGYEFGPAAEINKKNVHPSRKHANHVFYGPGYSIAHPGVFPFNPKAERWSVREWLLFDWRAGWGTDDFEDAVADGKIRVQFPDEWKEEDDRYDAREIIEDNLKKRAAKDRLRAMVMENGSHVDGPFFDGPQRVGQELKFTYIVTNTNEGHNLPTASLGAQPQLWANIVLIGPRGQRLWESGYLDSLGDLADIHSEEVRNKRLPFDWQLFNLQTMFLITGAKGTDREFFLPVNLDIDPLPFIRPAPQPVSVINHPPFIRMEARSLAPLGSRRVPYKIPAHLLCEPGRYRLSFRMRSRTEPLYFMRFCDSTAEMQRAMIEGTLDFHGSSVEFDVRR
jgi:hypothetical protein